MRAWFIILLTVAGPALAVPPAINLTCVTEPMTTSFGIWTEDNALRATVMHSYGAEYAPAINGVFTPHDLPILAERARLVRKMKDITTFRWPLSRCRRHDDYRFECFGTDDVQDGVDGSRIQPFALYTTRTFEEGIAGRYEKLKVTLSFSVDGKGDPSVAMDFPMENCRPVPGGSLGRQLRGPVLP